MFYVTFKTTKDLAVGRRGAAAPFSTRAVAEEHATALLKRKDVFPPINIVGKETKQEKGEPNDSAPSKAKRGVRNGDPLFSQGAGASRRRRPVTGSIPFRSRASSGDTGRERRHLRPPRPSR